MVRFAVVAVVKESAQALTTAAGSELAELAVELPEDEDVALDAAELDELDLLLEDEDTEEDEAEEDTEEEAEEDEVLDVEPL